MTHNNHHSYSFWQYAWRRLKKNKGAVLGLVIIFLAILTGIFAYFISNDTTPNADRQIVEIQAKKPGYKKQFIRIKKEKAARQTGFLSRLLYGKEESYQLVPINSYYRIKDSVVYQKFIDDGVEEKISTPLTGLPENFIETKTFWLGTDRFGRDILSRLIVGVRC